MTIEEQKALIEEVCKLRFTPLYFTRFPGFMRRNGKLTEEQISSAKSAIRIGKFLSMMKRKYPEDKFVAGCIDCFIQKGKLSGHQIGVLQSKNTPV